uniref:Uncharacterized protein n=1 Tax=Anguilla anguilla TaxID=7936 RepID=A0A0E9SEN0_ANGAN
MRVYIALFNKAQFMNRSCDLFCILCKGTADRGHCTWRHIRAVIGCFVAFHAIGCFERAFL